MCDVYLVGFLAPRDSALLVELPELVSHRGWVTVHSGSDLVHGRPVPVLSDELAHEVVDAFTRFLFRVRHVASRRDRQIATPARADQ